MTMTSDLPPAPSAVIELVRCGCTISKCDTLACSCRRHELPCMELCVDEVCENRCSQNTVDVSDDDDEIE